MQILLSSLPHVGFWVDLALCIWPLENSSMIPLQQATQLRMLFFLGLPGKRRFAIWSQKNSLPATEQVSLGPRQWESGNSQFLVCNLLIITPWGVGLYSQNHFALPLIKAEWTQFPTSQIFPRPQRLLYKRPGLISGQVYNSCICMVMNYGLSGQEAWSIVRGSMGLGNHLSPDCIVLQRISRLEGEPMDTKEWSFRKRLTALSSMHMNVSTSCNWWQGEWN